MPGLSGEVIFAVAGDPGSSRFCLSLADKVFRVFGGDSIRTLTADMGGADGVPIVSPLLSAALDEAQSQVGTTSWNLQSKMGCLATKPWWLNGEMGKEWNLYSGKVNANPQCSACTVGSSGNLMSCVIQQLVMEDHQPVNGNINYK